MFGGRNFRESQFNLAAQAAAARLGVQADRARGGDERGHLSCHRARVEAVSIDAGDRIWRVTNYDKTYLGRVSLSRAMVSSDNSVYAQLTDLVGPKAIVKTSHSLGIRSRLARTSRSASARSR